MSFTGVTDPQVSKPKAGEMSFKSSVTATFLLSRHYSASLLATEEILQGLSFISFLDVICLSNLKDFQSTCRPGM